MWCPLLTHALQRIHGLPLEEWAGVPATYGPIYPEEVATQDQAQWCAHGIPSFRPWHRAYVRLFEINLCRVATSEAVTQHYRGHPHEKEYAAAAKALRMPYVLWEQPGAAPAPSTPAGPTCTFGVPGPVSVVDVRRTSGKVDIENPLAFYTFTREVSDSTTQLVYHVPDEDKNNITHRHPKGSPPVTVVEDFYAAVTDPETVLGFKDSLEE